VKVGFSSPEVQERRPYLRCSLSLGSSAFSKDDAHCVRCSDQRGRAGGELRRDPVRPGGAGVPGGQRHLGGAAAGPHADPAAAQGHQDGPHHHHVLHEPLQVRAPPRPPLGCAHAPAAIVWTTSRPQGAKSKLGSLTLPPVDHCWIRSLGIALAEVIVCK
jgi:hypothetical protein